MNFSQANIVTGLSLLIGGWRGYPEKKQLSFSNMAKDALTPDNAIVLNSTQVNISSATSTEPSPTPNITKDDSDANSPTRPPLPNRLRDDTGPESVSVHKRDVNALTKYMGKLHMKPARRPTSPKINAGLYGARKVCSAADCSRKSAPNFDGEPFYCHQHGHFIPVEWRFQCVGNKKDSSGRCNIYSYRILHTDVEERTYRCQFHIHNGSGNLLRSQKPSTNSRDIMVRLAESVQGQNIFRNHILLSGTQFDGMCSTLYFSLSFWSFGSGLLLKSCSYYLLLLRRIGDKLRLLSTDQESYPRSRPELWQRS